MKEWYAALELVGLPGMAATRENITRRAGRESWFSRPRQGRGGGREYHIDSLPEETRAHLLAQLGGQDASAAREPEAGSEAPPTPVLVPATPPVTAATPKPAPPVAKSGDDSGGGKVIDITSRLKQLPVNEAIQRRHEEKKAAQLAKRADGLAKLAQVPEKVRMGAWAREFVLRAWDEHAEAERMGPRAAAEDFCAMLAAGKVEVPEQYRSHLPRQAVSVSTLYRWKKAYDAEGTWGLVDQRELAGRRRRQGEIVRSRIDAVDGLGDIIVAMLIEEPHITAKSVLRYLEATEPNLPSLSIRSVERWIARWKAEHPQEYEYALDPDGWKNRYEAAHGSHHENIERLHQVWEMDSTPTDWMLLEVGPDGKPKLGKDGQPERRRHVIIGVIDLYSRRIKLLVSRTSKASAVATVFRRAVIDWKGLPETVRTDNGKDYVSQHFTTVLANLGITHARCRPYESREKGTIERALGDMTGSILAHLPGYIGRNVAERKAIESRGKGYAERREDRLKGAQREPEELNITAAELQRRLDQWTDQQHLHDQHEGLGGRTPFDMEQTYTGPRRHVPDERALDMLLMPAVDQGREVTKKGVRVGNNYYTSPILGRYAGKHVQVRWDEDNPAFIYLYEDDGQFIDVARCPELLGESRLRPGVDVRKDQKRWLRSTTASYKEPRKALKKGNVATTVLDAAEARNGNLTPFRGPSEEVSTPALEAAAEAAKAVSGEDLHEVDPRHAERAAEVQAEAKQNGGRWQFYSGELREMEMSQREKFRLCIRLERRAEAGEALTDEERTFMKGFRHSAAYRGELAVHIEYGMQVDGQPVQAAVRPDPDIDEKQESNWR